MRKHLLSFLSMVGLVSLATPAPAQGDKPKKAGVENNAVNNQAAKKARKAGGEQKAAQDVVNEKIGPDHIVHKHIGGVKYESAQAESNASQNQATVKLHKPNAEKAAGKHDASKKVLIGLSEPQKTGPSEAKIKFHKGNTANTAGDGSVKPSTGGGKSFGVENPTTIGGGAGKTKAQSVHIKKAVKATSEANAIQSGIQDKRGKTGAENAAVGNETTRKDKWRKADAENAAAKTEAVQQGGEKKTDKATPK